METTATKSPVLIYTEQTPNPESLKFVTNRMLYTNNTADFREEELAIEWSPLGKALFELIDEKTMVNAIVGLLATGGSTNHTIHIIAIAKAAGIIINWDDFSDL